MSALNLRVEMARDVALAQQHGGFHRLLVSTFDSARGQVLDSLLLKVEHEMARKEALLEAELSLSGHRDRSSRCCCSCSCCCRGAGARARCAGRAALPL